MKAMGVVVVLLVIAGLQVRAGVPGINVETAKPLQQDVQIVSDELQIALIETRLEYKDSAWPRDIDKARVDKSRVPAEVLAKTSQWLRTMIKGRYLPQDPNDWLIPIRKAKPGFYRISTSIDAINENCFVFTNIEFDFIVSSYRV